VGEEGLRIEGAIRKREDMVSGDGDADEELKSLQKATHRTSRARPKLLRTMIMRELPEPRDHTSTWAATSREGRDGHARCTRVSCIR
jgi:hypothetical protein